MEELKKTIDDLKTTIQAAKDKQKTANEEVKKLERDMAEFKDNKEGKIDELKVSRAQYDEHFSLIRSIDQHLAAESRTSETCSYCQN